MYLKRLVLTLFICAPTTLFSQTGNDMLILKNGDSIQGKGKYIPSKQEIKFKFSNGSKEVYKMESGVSLLHSKSQKLIKFFNDSSSGAYGPHELIYKGKIEIYHNISKFETKISNKNGKYILSVSKPAFRFFISNTITDESFQVLGYQNLYTLLFKKNAILFFEDCQRLKNIIASKVVRDQESIAQELIQLAKIYESCD